MPRYYIECHEDGEFLPTHAVIIEADAENEATGKALLKMIDERGQLEELAIEDGVQIYEWDGETLPEPDLIYNLEEIHLIDVCVELPAGFSGEPATCLEDAVTGLLEQLDDPILRQTLEVQQKVRNERSLAIGGLY